MRNRSAPARSNAPQRINAPTASAEITGFGWVGIGRGEPAAQRHMHWQRRVCRLQSLWSNQRWQNGKARHHADRDASCATVLIAIRATIAIILGRAVHFCRYGHLGCHTARLKGRYAHGKSHACPEQERPNGFKRQAFHSAANDASRRLRKQYTQSCATTGRCKARPTVAIPCRHASRVAESPLCHEQT